MSRAVRLLLEFGFTTCGFHVVHWWARVGNWPSRRVAWATRFRLSEMIPALAEEGGRRVDAWTGWIRPADPRKPRRPWFEIPVLETRGCGSGPGARTRSSASPSPEPEATARPPVHPAALHRGDARFWLKDLAEPGGSRPSLQLVPGGRCQDRSGPRQHHPVQHLPRRGARRRTRLLGPPRRTRPRRDDRGHRASGALVLRPETRGRPGRPQTPDPHRRHQHRRPPVAEKSGFHHAGTEREAFRLATHLDDKVTYERSPPTAAPEARPCPSCLSVSVCRSPKPGLSTGQVDSGSNGGRW